MENMSLSDIAAVTRGNDDGDGWGGNTAGILRLAAYQDHELHG